MPALQLCMEVLIGCSGKEADWRRVAPSPSKRKTTLLNNNNSIKTTKSLYEICNTVAKNCTHAHLFIICIHPHTALYVSDLTKRIDGDWGGVRLYEDGWMG